MQAAAEIIGCRAVLRAQRRHGAHEEQGPTIRADTMADIFLSHESADRQRVAPIVALLEASGRTVSWDASGDAGIAGDVALERQLSAAGCVVVAWSLDAADSDDVWFAASTGLERGSLVSVSLDIAKPPSELCPSAPISFAGWSGDASSPRAQELLAAVELALGQARTLPPTVAPEPAPSPAPHIDAQPSPPEQVATEAAAATPTHTDWAEPGDLDQTPSVSDALDGIRATEVLAWDEDAGLGMVGRQETWDAPAGPQDTWVEPRDAPAEAQDAWTERQEAWAEYQDWAERQGRAERQDSWAERQDSWTEPQDTWDPAVDVVEDPEQLGQAPTVLRHPIRRAPSPSERGQRGSTNLPAVLLGILLIISVAAFSMKGWISRVYTGSGPVAVAVPKPAPPPPVHPPQQAPPAPAQKAAVPPRRDAPPPPATPPQPPRIAAPAPADLPNSLEIEDLLAQVTPQRVEQLLVDARRLIRVGDIQAAREMLEVPETESSGVLTFMLAETYDPNVLSATLRGTLADPEHARQLYRKARELGDNRAQQRLDSLKASDCQPKSSSRLASSACGSIGLPG
ncbi:MAG TPA: TIR domain-containing protein [Hyphomicrobiaceae bacterium]|nr:TIR domain-containing protein [Hyphomicrobiaceae bacterium]